MVSSTRTILLVEDNAADARLAIKVLKDSCHLPNVYHVSSGTSALRFLNREADFKMVPVPDLIILDLNLPEKSGRETLKAIKSSERFRHIPVVILTSSDSEHDIYESFRNYANAYVTKSVDLYEFVDVLKSFEKFWFHSAKIPHAVS